MPLAHINDNIISLKNNLLYGGIHPRITIREAGEAPSIAAADRNSRMDES
jgi:hypothetical protein